MQQYKTTLTIAGSDCSGGAGIQADLKTFSALGCYGMSVITALTAQNTQGVQAIKPLSAEFVKQQFNSVSNDILIHALKIGMLYNAETIATIAECLKTSSIPFIIVDPVMLAKDKSRLLQLSAIEALCTRLFPLASLITPNLNEAELIIQQTIPDQKAMAEAAKQLCRELGVAACLIKGGHLASAESSDCLYIVPEDNYYWFTAPRVNTVNTHGTGCTLSAAITAYLARGYSLLEAVKLAKKYLTQAIIQGSSYQLGHGHGPVHHFAGIW